MLVVLFVISLLLSILVPSLGKVRRHARALHSRSNLREIARAVNVYAVDNNDWYPPSVATNGPDVRFLSWTMPNRLVAVDAQGPRVHRSISAYLGSYVGDVEVMQCPNAPRRFRYLQDAKGINLARTLVGEYLTVQEMGGFQMCVARMDDEMLELWDAPCCTPALTIC